MSSLIYIYFILLSSVIILFIKSLLPFVFFMFFTTIFFIWNIGSPGKKIKFFLAQELGRILFICCLLIKLGPFFLALVIFFKIGLPPFHFWFVQILGGWQHLIIFLSIFKVPGIWILFFTGGPLFFFIFLVGYRHWLIFNNLSIKYLFYISSSSNRYWIIILSRFLHSSAIYYFFFYVSILTLSLIFLIGHLEIIIPLFIFIGLPPLPIFFLKWIFIISLSNQNLIRVLILILFIFSLISYFRLVIYLIRSRLNIIQRPWLLPAFFFPLGVRGLFIF